jgi:proteasome lid subunit RPN8/RPN11
MTFPTTQPSIHLSGAALRVIFQDAQKTFPFECCGFLYGNEEDGRTVTVAVPVENVKEGDQRRRFEVSPADYMRAERFALENGLLLLGVYHSHPNHPAIASQHDLAVAMPWFSYVIVSVMEGEIADIKSWRLHDEVRQFEEELVFTPFVEENALF